MGGASARSSLYAGVGERQSEAGAGEREDDGFGQRLPYQRPTAAAHRGAHGEFALAQGGADQQEVGDVGAGDQQQEDDGAHQGQQRGAHFFDDVGVHRLEAYGVAGGAGDEEVLARFGGDAVDGRLRLFDASRHP